METGMKIGRCLIACGVALVTAGTVPLEVYASSPEFARSEKEWARLQDDVLEYDEIEALIAEYNATVQTNQLDLNEFKKKYGNTKDDISAKYRDMAEEIYASVEYPDADDPTYGFVANHCALSAGNHLPLCPANGASVLSVSLPFIVSVPHSLDHSFITFI